MRLLVRDDLDRGKLSRGRDIHRDTVLGDGDDRGSTDTYGCDLAHVPGPGIAAVEDTLIDILTVDRDAQPRSIVLHHSDPQGERLPGRDNGGRRFESLFVRDTGDCDGVRLGDGSVLGLGRWQRIGGRLSRAE